MPEIRFIKVYTGKHIQHDLISPSVPPLADLQPESDTTPDIYYTTLWEN